MGLRIANNEAVDKFLWDHRKNGCTSIPHPTFVEDGLSLNMLWQDNETGEFITIEYVDANGGA